MSGQHIYFVAAEASGSLLALEVISEIRDRRPDVQISAIGGRELSAAGLVSPVDVSPLSVLGFLEGIKAYGDVVRLADAACAEIIRAAPDVVVLVDSWGFMLRVAQRLRLAAPHIRLVKLIGPQVWATRPGRARTLASTVDHLLCMYDLEGPFYEPFGLKTTVIGNPALHRGGRGDREGFRAAYKLAPEDRAILILPGSRTSEVRRVAPAMMDAARLIRKADPQVRLFVQPAGSISEQFKARFSADLGVFTLLEDEKARFDAMAGADVVIACSGTVTSEVAMQGTPMAVCYKTGWMTWALARGLLYKRTHITLLNILNEDSPVVPEFVQTQLKPDLIARTVSGWLQDPEALNAQKRRQAEALPRLIQTETPAARVAAGAILSELAQAGRLAIET
ncbi:lipid-A-disaccharide synthase [Hyphomonas sp.]|uniref:lipid-A-disaccharide synthase n=1 Tax=Hyphomonas sp. TaxID=87 RepID=UPI00391D67DB